VPLLLSIFEIFKIVMLKLCLSNVLITIKRKVNLTHLDD
jgi:hypothetical protein